MKKAFTLADVIITLGIIGVVASMTMPTLLKATNDSEHQIQKPKVEKSKNYDYDFTE